MAKLRNRLPCVMSMAADTALLLVVESVVFALFNGLRRQNLVEFAAARMLIGPRLDGVEHIPLNLNMLVTKGGVVECPQHVVDNFFDGHTGVLPCVENATLITLVRS